MYITEFGGYDFPTEQLELTESSGAARRGATSALGGMGGAWDDLGFGPDPLSEDTISKTLILEGSGASESTRKTSLRTQYDALLAVMMQSPNDYYQGTRLLVAPLPDGSKRGTWAKCVECRARWEYFNVNMGWLPVSLLFRRAWPLWEKIFHTDGTLKAMYLGDHLGTLQDTDDANYLLNQGLSSWAMSSSTTQTFTNGGNARQSNVLVEFDGAITNPRLTNLTNGHYFEYDGTLATGDRLTVRSPQCTARLNGALVALTIGTGRGQILPLCIEPGANSLKLTGSGSISGNFRVWAPDAYY